MCVVLGLSWRNKLFLVCIIHWTCKMCWGDWIISVCLFYQLSLGKKNIFVTLLCIDHSSSVWSLMLPLLVHFLVMADDRGVFQSQCGGVATVSFVFLFFFFFFHFWLGQTVNSLNWRSFTEPHKGWWGLHEHSFHLSPTAPDAVSIMIQSIMWDTVLTGYQLHFLAGALTLIAL